MGSFMGSLFSTVHRFIGLAQDLRSGIPICNLARVKCRDLDLEKSDELQKLGKNKAPSCAKLRQAALPLPKGWCVWSQDIFKPF